ncbi:translation initiation factor IF-2 N-terminal domain-containing protein, partial [Planktomarina temperata]|nr:translation initiation factor IF-2 N-terminal domain-containing protein [Planktomarina temperata]
MSDDGKKTLGLMGGSRSGNVKQSFSHGRTKNVVVETKRKRVVVPKPGAAKPAAPGAVRGGDPARRPAGISDAEMERRLKAVQAAKARETEDAARRAQEDLEREAERNRRREEQETKERELREREERTQAKVAAEEQKKREAEAAALLAAAPPPTPEERAAKTGVVRNKVAEPVRREEPARPSRNKGREDNRRSGKLTVNQASAGNDGRHRSMASMKRKQERARQKAMGGTVEREKIIRDVQVPDAIMVQELANRMAERVSDVVKSLMQMGMMVTQNQTIDQDTAELIVEEFGHKIVRVSDADVEDVIDQVVDSPEDLKSRAPIITVMGHVDHGKTSLLDAIRNARVVSGEAGGITQHIGAYQVEQNGDLLTFLDTPGHAAFTSMRSRGAQVTDIVILVVAADDAVMPQTIEAIAHAKAANVPMIVAINKIDRPAADPQKVRTDLLQHEVIVEQMSGEVQDVEVSATTGQGLDQLLEAIALQSEILELKANPNRAASGAVIEAQ